MSASTQPVFPPKERFPKSRRPVSPRGVRVEPEVGVRKPVGAKQLQKLTKEMNQLEVLAGRATAIPTLFRRFPGSGFEVAEDYDFRSELNYPLGDERRMQLPQNHLPEFPRLVNNWVLCEAGTRNPVVPALRKPGVQHDKAVYSLYGVMNPGNDGARRLTYTYTGYTPLRKPSDPQLWQLQTKLMVARVSTPFRGHFSFRGCQLPATIFPSAVHEDYYYAVQNPDKNYRAYADLMVAMWKVHAAKGHCVALEEWEDVDVGKPRLWFMNKWATGLMRMERGLPRDHPDDPQRLAMLGECRLPPHNRAPTTEEEWAILASEVGDDECDGTDAGSLVDDYENPRPCSWSWNPETGRSTEPQGNEPHPFPEVIAAQRERNRLWLQRQLTASEQPQPAQQQWHPDAMDVDPAESSSGPGGETGGLPDRLPSDEVTGGSNPSSPDAHDEQEEEEETGLFGTPAPTPQAQPASTSSSQDIEQALGAGSSQAPSRSDVPIEPGLTGVQPLQVPPAPSMPPPPLPPPPATPAPQPAPDVRSPSAPPPRPISCHHLGPRRLDSGATQARRGI
ncbi:hypothetical protein RhiLY_08521 [Ceratobasidium sp. AG-Ba]|nr:hypothetical protein RhiLY_08521 [Ceratobasidium sp. AG-Ba]